MPQTFWTFLIGGLALSGFPLLTAGFWSKDEILAEAFVGGTAGTIVFITLALAAFLTAFYTMRQISLTFLGKARTKAAEHAHESTWTMTYPLIVLAVFAVGAGWVGIPEHFPVIGGLIPNWFHEFVGGTLLEHPYTPEFSWVPLLTSLGVALGGLGLGWLVYRDVKAGAVDPLARAFGPVYTVLENKYYFDELYDRIFIKPMYWFADNVVYRFLDRTVIDGFLHAVARASSWIGANLRRWIDMLIINQGIGDGIGFGTNRIGRFLRVIQTGRVQEYLLVGFIFIGLVLIYLLGPDVFAAVGR
jgi:NADH-quinone oxidoreductase subunit L